MGNSRKQPAYGFVEGVNYRYSQVAIFTIEIRANCFLALDLYTSFTGKTKSTVAVLVGISGRTLMVDSNSCDYAFQNLP